MDRQTKLREAVASPTPITTLRLGRRVRRIAGTALARALIGSQSNAEWTNLGIFHGYLTFLNVERVLKTGRYQTNTSKRDIEHFAGTDILAADVFTIPDALTVQSPCLLAVNQRNRK